jgi:hypothetical protein
MMKKILNIKTALALMASLLLGGCNPAARPVKWEYEVKTYSVDPKNIGRDEEIEVPEKDLNSEGADGWEIASAFYQPFSYKGTQEAEVVAIFKRPRSHQ